MNTRTLSESLLLSFRQHLHEEEKSPRTTEKYLRDARAFFLYAGPNEITKETVISFKNRLMQSGYQTGSINSILASVNSLLRFLGWEDCKTKNLRQQRASFCPEEKELTKAEYGRLLDAAHGNEQLRLLLQTICSTGIRVSELQYFTVEALRRSQVTIHCKSKTRTILVPGQLKKLLLSYAAKRQIRSGAIFITRGGNPLNRSNIWAQMKKLCSKAGVQPSKVFPHNLRKLFARTFYAMEKDIAKLADILGHSSVNTTRIYIMSTGTEHRRKIENLGLILRI